MSETPVRGGHPTGCAVCDPNGWPVEGMTVTCPACGDVVCAGHQRAHANGFGNARRCRPDLVWDAGYSERPRDVGRTLTGVDVAQ